VHVAIWRRTQVNECRVLLGKREVKNRLEDLDVEGVKYYSEWVILDSIPLLKKKKMTSSCENCTEHCNGPSSLINGREFLDFLRNY
jgi:hypothetical protein